MWVFYLFDCCLKFDRKFEYDVICVKKEIHQIFSVFRLISFLVSICHGHTIVEDKCPSKVIYTFDSENYVSGKIQKFETKHYLLSVSHFETPVNHPIHELKIAPKNQPDRMIISKFEGVVFEVLKLELDKRGFGEEFWLQTNLVLEVTSILCCQVHRRILTAHLWNVSSVNSQRKASNDIGHFLKVIIRCSLILMIMVNVTS